MSEAATVAGRCVYILYPAIKNNMLTKLLQQASHVATVSCKRRAGSHSSTAPGVQVMVASHTPGNPSSSPGQSEHTVPAWWLGSDPQAFLPVTVS